MNISDNCFQSIVLPSLHKTIPDLPIGKVIVVDGPAYSALNQADKFSLARLVGELNRSIDPAEQAVTLLIGPGRWGTSIPDLGVSVRFADINQISVLVEVADLVESKMAYVALFPHQRHTRYCPEW